MNIEEQEYRLIDLYIDLTKSRINSSKRYLIINVFIFLICFNILIFDAYKGMVNQSAYSIFMSGSLFTIIFFLMLFVFEVIFDYITEKKLLNMYMDTKADMSKNVLLCQ